MSSPDEKRLPADDQRSVSDGDLESEKKRRRVRRRRGNRGRYRPYDISDADAQPGSSSAGEKKVRHRNGKPMAPNNTTQFLLEDMEARAEAEREVENTASEERQRVRSISVSSELVLGSDDGSDSIISDAEHREFETELEEFNMDRLANLSKVEMTREILDMDRTAEVYHENLVKMNRENERLRRILKDNGIPLEQDADKSPARPQPVA